MVIKQGAVTLTFCWDMDWHCTEKQHLERLSKTETPFLPRGSSKKQGPDRQQSWNNCNKEGSGKRTEALEKEEFSTVL